MHLTHPYEVLAEAESRKGMLDEADATLDLAWKHLNACGEVYAQSELQRIAARVRQLVMRVKQTRSLAVMKLRWVSR